MNKQRRKELIRQIQTFKVNVWDWDAEEISEGTRHSLTNGNICIFPYEKGAEGLEAWVIKYDTCSYGIMLIGAEMELVDSDGCMESAFQILDEIFFRFYKSYQYLFNDEQSTIKEFEQFIYKYDKVDDRKKTKYTLTELLKKCDESAPIPQELVDWEKINFSDTFDVKNTELIECALKLKEAIYDTEITRKQLGNALARIEEIVEENYDLTMEFVKDILVGLNEIKSGELSEYHFLKKEKKQCKKIIEDEKKKVADRFKCM